MISSFYGNTNIKVINKGLRKSFYETFTAESILKENGISVDDLLELLLNLK